MLRVENLIKIYPNGTQALKDVSFEVEDGEFLAVIGLSGSGKSTLLRCINRLIEPTSGKIFWMTWMSPPPRGRPAQNPPPDRHGLPAIQPGQTLLRVYQCALRAAGICEHSFEQPAYFFVRKPGACPGQPGAGGPGEKAYVRADSLSGGQQQRVGIARALMQDPKLILADEPVASLDPVLAHSILKYLEQLNKERGITVLCSLHFLDLVHRYATRAIALKDGELVFEGLPKEIDDAQFKAIYGQEAERVSII